MNDRYAFLFYILRHFPCPSVNSVRNGIWTLESNTKMQSQGTHRNTQKKILTRYYFSDILEIDLIVRRDIDRFTIAND